MVTGGRGNLSNAHGHREAESNFKGMWDWPESKIGSENSETNQKRETKVYGLERITNFGRNWGPQVFQSSVVT